MPRFIVGNFNSWQKTREDRQPQPEPQPEPEAEQGPVGLPELLQQPQEEQQEEEQTESEPQGLTEEECEVIRQTALSHMALNQPFRTPENYVLRMPGPDVSPPTRAVTGQFYVFHSAPSKAALQRYKDGESAAEIENEPVFLQSLAPLIDYIPLDVDVSTMLRPIALQTFKSRYYRFNIIQVIQNYYGLPIQLCIGDGMEYIPAHISMCGFSHVYFWVSRITKEGRERPEAHKVTCPVCKRVFMNGGQREEAINTRNPNVVYGTIFTYDGLQYVNGEYKLYLRVEEGRRYPRIVLRLEDNLGQVPTSLKIINQEYHEKRVSQRLAAKQAARLAQEAEREEREEKKQQKRQEKEQKKIQKPSTFREDSNPFESDGETPPVDSERYKHPKKRAPKFGNRFAKVDPEPSEEEEVQEVETNVEPHQEPQPEPEPEPQDSINTEGVNKVLNRDLYSSLRELLETNVKDPALQTRLDTWAQNNNADMLTFTKIDQPDIFVLRFDSCEDMFV